MNDKLIAALRRKTGVEPWEMTDSELLSAFEGTLNMAGAALNVAFRQLWEEVVRPMPRWLRERLR